MFELTYDILDDLECISPKSSVEKILDAEDERIAVFENMTPVEWYDAARERGCNCMFTISFIYSKHYKDNVYIIGETLNDLVYRYFGDNLKVQAVYFEEDIDSDIVLPDDVRKEERIDTFNFLGHQVKSLHNQVTYKIALNIDFEHPNPKIIHKTLGFITSLMSFKVYIQGALYFVHQNGYSQILSHHIMYKQKILKHSLEDCELSQVLKDLCHIFSAPVDSSYSEYFIKDSYADWLTRYHKNTGMLEKYWVSHYTYSPNEKFKDCFINNVHT